ncbi:MAG: PhzF family phenazine biosynthesis protein [Bacteroidales bacterium]|nr:PhzF family phenazine biosynthesis protein [Bacteroidales bacterium]
MKKIKFFQVDAFTDHLFGGNPAAVCLLDQWLDDRLMQAIAMENNLSETAFVVKQGDRFAIRWFTPTVEVDLCGHATLASAFVIFNHSDFQGGEIIFHSLRSGELKVRQDLGKLFLDFPADEIHGCDMIPEIIKGTGSTPLEVYRGKSDYMAVFGSEEEVLGILPDFDTIEKIDARGLIVTAHGNTVDFVSRFFGPQSGVDEDPVTGSAHTTLIPYWSGRLGKTILHAKQLSKRVGNLDCQFLPPRVIIGGEAQLFASGEIILT